MKSISFLSFFSSVKFFVAIVLFLSFSLPSLFSLPTYLDTLDKAIHANVLAHSQFHLVYRLYSQHG